jgi:hypothetical protein
MSDSERYTIDESRIVSETVDGEAILVNLTNGYYYSLDTPAAEIWAWLQSGRSIAEIVSAIRGRYDCSASDPEPAVRALIDSFVADELVAPFQAGTGPGEVEPPRETSAPRSPFRAPSMQRFSDMQGLLLVDPIHEVDDTGWPHTQPGTSPAG